MIPLFVRLGRLAVAGCFVALVVTVCCGTQTARAMTVSAAMPNGKVNDLTQITVRFSETMRPLGDTAISQHTVPLRLTVEQGTLPAGNFRWLDPSTLAYMFDAPVARPIVIRALVPKGTTSLTGNALDADVAWVVCTPPLSLKLEGSPHRKLPQHKASFSLLANYPLDEARLKARSTLSVNGKVRSYTLTGPAPDTYRRGRPGAWRYTYTLNGTLAKNSTVTLDIAPGVTATEGGIPAEGASFSLQSYGDLCLTGYRLGRYGPDDQDEVPQPESPLYLTFSNRVRLSDLVRHVSVSPDVPLRNRQELLASQALAAGFSLPYQWEPRTRYTVTLKAGLRDEYGSALGKTQTIRFTTGDYSPFLQMPAGQMVMERGHADRFPLSMRNIGVVTATLRYLPWGQDAFSALGNPAPVDSPTFRALVGARESTLVMDTGKKPNHTLHKDLDIPAALGLPSAPGGLLDLTLTLPEGTEAARQYGLPRLRATLQTTDLGIVARMGEQQGLVWVASIAAATPVSGAAVHLLDTDGRTLWRGRSDADGMVLIPGLLSFPSTPRFILAKTNSDSSVLPLSHANLPLRKDDYAHTAKQTRWAVHAISQLPLYQAGQQVNAVLFARHFTGAPQDVADWTPLAGEDLTIRVADRTGKTVFTVEGKTNAYGSVPFSFTLGDEAEPGRYTIRAKRRTVPYEAAHTPFRVAAFRPPEFAVDLLPPPSGPVSATTTTKLPLTVNARYFSGTLLPSAPVSVAAEYTYARFSPSRLSGYTTGPLPAPRGRPQTSVLRTDTVSGTLDDTGKAVLSLPSPGKSPTPRRLSLTATVTDASGLTSQGTASSLLHPSAYYIGLRVPFMANRGKETQVMLKAATWDDRPLASLPVSLTAERIITVRLKVAGTTPRLSVSVTTDAATYRPGGTVRASVTVTGNGKGKQAQVTLLAVDERVLRAGGEVTAYDPQTTFTPLFPHTVYGTTLWRSLLRYGQAAIGPDMVRMGATPNAPTTATVEKSAAGSVRDSSGQEISLRHNFAPLVFWLAEGETDKNGELSVSFSLPDTLTRYRIAAVAADAQCGFAVSHTALQTRQTLQLLPALPKFAVEGDRLDAGILVQNTGDVRSTAAVTLEIVGAAFADRTSPSQTISLDGGHSALLRFPLEIPQLSAARGTLHVRALARMGEESDAAAFTLPVIPARPLTYMAAAGMLKENERSTLPVKAPADLDKRSSLEVSLAPSPVAGIPIAAGQLLSYPWHCLEQRLSRIWARLIRLEHGPRIGLTPDADDREQIARELAAIPSYQRADGSFALWPGMQGQDADGLDLFITAYALLVDLVGKDSGFALPDHVRNKALDYTATMLQTLLQSDPKTERSRTVAPETLALALRVLVPHRAERAAALFMQVLSVCQTWELSPFGWGALLLTLEHLAPGEREDAATRILTGLEKTASVTATQMHFAAVQDNGSWRTLGSRLRDNGMVLAALAVTRPEHPRLDALAAWVGQRLGDTGTLTTQEAVFGLWGLTEYLESLGRTGETAIRAVWNGTEETVASFTTLVQPPLLWRVPSTALNGGNASDLILHAVRGRPYWVARLAWASPDLPLRVENAGFSIRRTTGTKGP